MSDQDDLTSEQWREKYKILESKMYHFHNQAMTIKTKFATKIEELTKRCAIANTRAEQADNELVDLQREYLDTLNSQSDKDEEIIELQQRLAEKEDVIKELQGQLCKLNLPPDEGVVRKQEIIEDLEYQLENEKAQRKIEGDLLTSKAVEIKNWVELKLSQVEGQKLVLIGANKRASDALSEWQAKVQELSIELSRARTELREKSMDRSEKYKHVRMNEHQNVQHMMVDCDMDKSEIKNVLQTNNKKGKLKGVEHSHSFSHNEYKHVLSVPTNTHVVRSKSLDKQHKPTRWTRNKHVSEHKEDLMNTNSLGKKQKKKSPDKKDAHQNSLIGTFTRKFRGLTDANTSHRLVQRSHSAGKRDEKFIKAKSKHISSPPVVAKEQLKIHKTGSYKSNNSHFLDEVNEIMDVCSNKNEPLSMSLPSSILKPSINRKMLSHNRPPKLPTHRIPTWETRILSQLQNSFVISFGATSKPSYAKKYSSIHHHSPDDCATDLYKNRPLCIPVYTRINGRIAKLQNVPFSQLSESSDDEDLPLSLETKRSMRNRSASTDITMSIQQRSPGFIRALKRANSVHSVASSEGDYAIPPDAMSNSSDSSEPENKLFKTNVSDVNGSYRRSRHSSSESANNGGNLNKAAVVTKCGFLTKLGGKSRTWRRRWFVINGGKLDYYKSNNTNCQSIGSIDLMSDCSVLYDETNDIPCLFRMQTDKRTYHLIADSQLAVEDWVKEIQTAIGCPVTNFELLRNNRNHEQCLLQGWVVKVNDGRRKLYWTCVGVDSIYFYRDQDRNTLVSNIPLKDSHVGRTTGNSICISLPSNQESITLDFNNEHEKEAWMYRLTLASGSLSLSMNISNHDFAIGTAFETIMTRLLYSALCDASSGDNSTSIAAASPLWRNPVLAYSNEGLSQPLTSLSTVGLKQQAVQISKMFDLFIKTTLNTDNLTYHTTMIQQICMLCFANAQLQEETLALLVKLTNRKKVRHNDDRTSNEEPRLMSWKLFSLIISLFVPHERMLWFVSAHLQRHSDPSTDVGQYASYCRQALGRAAINKGRQCAPTCIEITSILTKNPAQHSLPFSAPVHLPNGEYKVVSFDSSSTVQEFICHSWVDIGGRDPVLPGVVLLSDNPVPDNQTQHILPSQAKICDIISAWEEMYSDIHKADVHPDHTQTIKLSLQLQLCSNTTILSDMEKILSVHQISMLVVDDVFPLSHDLCFELSALFHQLTCGDASVMVDDVLRCYPKRYLDNASKSQTKEAREKIVEKWKSLQGVSNGESARVFLTTISKYPQFGSYIFKAKKSKNISLWLAVGPDWLSELHYKTMAVIRSFPCNEINTFGSCHGELLVVVEISGASAKLVYQMNNLDILAVISTMKDFMKNLKVRKKPN